MFEYNCVLICMINFMQRIASFVLDVKKVKVSHSLIAVGAVGG